MTGPYFEPWQLITLATVQAAGLICDIWLFDYAHRVYREWGMRCPTA
jgi:hypothetical protein